MTTRADLLHRSRHLRDNQLAFDNQTPELEPFIVGLEQFVIDGKSLELSTIGLHSHHNIIVDGKTIIGGCLVETNILEA